MTLDKFFGKKSTKPAEVSGKKEREVTHTVPTKKKYVLRCSNGRCKHKRTIVSKRLIESDWTCPRCGKSMKKIA